MEILKMMFPKWYDKNKDKYLRINTYKKRLVLINCITYSSFQLIRICIFAVDFYKPNH